MNRRKHAPFKQKHRRMRRCWPESLTSRRLTSRGRDIQAFQQTLICTARLVQLAIRCALLQEAAETSSNLSGRRPPRSESLWHFSLSCQFKTPPLTRLIKSLSRHSACNSHVAKHPNPVRRVKPRVARQTLAGLCVPHNRRVDKFPNFHDNIKDCGLTVG